jgi:hypothetical protein
MSNRDLGVGGRGGVQLRCHAEAAEQLGIAVGLQVFGGEQDIADENGIGASISMPSRSPTCSPIPMMPPQQTLSPALRAWPSASCAS